MTNELSSEFTGTGVRSAYARDLRDAYCNINLVKFGVIAVFVMTIAVIFVSVAGSVLVQMAITGQRYRVTSFLNVSSDASFAEGYIHGISFLTAAMLLACFALSRARVCLSLSLTYAFIWFDDSFAYHEQFGELLAARLEYPQIAWMRTQEMGEITAWLLAAAVLSPIFVWALMQKHALNWPTLGAFALCFGLLAVAGIAVDAVHGIYDAGSLSKVLGLVEDGGEMIALAASAALAMLLLGAVLRRQSAGG